jgi:hypothetical protein
VSKLIWSIPSKPSITLTPSSPLSLSLSLSLLLDVRFLAHFVRVYEGAAPQFARDAFRWSADPKNFEDYVADGREMKDILGGRSQRWHSESIRRDEAFDGEWPYNTEKEEGKEWLR